MGEESTEQEVNPEERSGLAERERQDRERAEANRERQIRQGVISEESEGEEPEEAA